MAVIDIHFDPNNFAGGPITNQFMPLAVGNTWGYKVTDGSTDTVTVTSQTININGVECVVVKDIVQEGNKITESTKDYFAQDKDGNVWYFGEDTKTLQPGGVDRTGTWRADTANNVFPGVIMLADPHKGDSYLEENAPGVAVDQAAVTSLKAMADVPLGQLGPFTKCLQTSNSSILFPGDVESKFYAAGIGSVLEVDSDGTRQELVSFNGQTSGLPNLVQAMASFGGQQSSVASGHTTPHSEDSSLHHVLAAHSHHA
jgi:uncharacterized Zn-binding protein involved in type VI secretion